MKPSVTHSMMTIEQISDEEPPSSCTAPNTGAVTLEWAIEDERWHHRFASLQADVEHCIGYVWHHVCQIHALHVADKPCEISLLLTNDAEIQQLNAQYRKKDTPTNVLSFPQTDAWEGIAFLAEHAPIITLGDIVLSLDILEKEAQEKRISSRHHLLHLLVHGMLHLCGYDHIDDAEAEAMEQLEANILEHFSIPNPYIAQESHA